MTLWQSFRFALGVVGWIWVMYETVRGFVRFPAAMWALWKGRDRGDDYE